MKLALAPWVQKVTLGSLVALSSVVLLMPGTGGTAVLGQGDEFMHIATVRASLAEGRWLIPPNPGPVAGLPNAYKPPLLFWLSTISEAAWGSSLWAGRLPSVLAGAGTAALLFALLCSFHLGRVSAALVSLAYVGTVGTFKFARLLMMEQIMALLVLAVAFFLLRFARRPGSTGDLIAAGFLSGVGFLVKGPLFQFYAAILLVCWSYSVLIPHVVERRDRWKRVARAWVIFHLAALPSFLLWLALVYGSGWGAEILHFFFYTENVRKFARANQPGTRILFGWLLYTLPWTPILLYGFYKSLRSDARSPSSNAARILVASAVLMTLLHLLPNRKDAYYVIPAMPLLFAGVALGHLRNATLPAWMRYSAAGFIGLICLCMLWLLWWFHPLTGRVAMGTGLIAAAFVLAVLALCALPSTLRPRVFYAGAAFSLLLALQFAVLPKFSRPLLPDRKWVGLRDRSLCVVSEQPWDAFHIAATLPNTQIRHTLPGVAGCAPTSDFVLTIGGAPQGNPAFNHNAEAQSGSKVAPLEQWATWAEGISTATMYRAIAERTLVPELFVPVRLYARGTSTQANRNRTESGVRVIR